MLLTGGGTGGHLFPGLALAERLRGECGVHVAFAGAERGIEARLLPELGEELTTFAVLPFRGAGAGGALRAARALRSGISEARALLRGRGRPAVVVGLGGYSAAPLLCAAALEGIPSVLLEQNAVLGAGNRLLSLKADALFAGLPLGLPLRLRRRSRILGSPLRGYFSDAFARAAGNKTPIGGASQAAPSASERSHGTGARRMRVLVLGGSQGAGSLNRYAPEVLRHFDVEVRHQVGRGEVDAVTRAYAAAGVQAEVFSFLGEPGALYGEVDVALCRGGALTLAELSALGIPALVVPYPYAASDHQRANAEHYTRDGAVLILPDSDLATPNAARTFAELLGAGSGSTPNAHTLAKRAHQMRMLARPHAASIIANILHKTYVLAEQA